MKLELSNGSYLTLDNKYTEDEALQLWKMAEDDIKSEQLDNTQEQPANPIEPVAQDPTGELTQFNKPVEQPSQSTIAQMQAEANPKDTSDFSRGFKTSYEQLPELGYGLEAGAYAIGESALGEGGMLTQGKQEAVAKMIEAQKETQANAKESDSFTYAYQKAKEGDFNALADTVQYGLGMGLGQVSQAILTGGLGATVAKTAAETFAKEYTAKLVEQEALKVAEQTAARELTQEQIQQQAVKNVTESIANKGRDYALGAQAVGLEGGEILGDLAKQSTEQNRSLTAREVTKGLGATALAAAGEFYADRFGLDILGGKRLSEAGKYTEGLKGNLLRGAATGAKGGFIEGGTEFGQTLVEEAGKGKDPFSSESFRQAIDAAALGSIGGGGIGAIGGALSPAQQRPDQPATGEIDPSMLSGGLDGATAQTTAQQPDQPSSKWQETMGKIRGIVGENQLVDNETIAKDVMGAETIEDAIAAANHATDAMAFDHAMNMDQASTLAQNLTKTDTDYLDNKDYQDAVQLENQLSTVRDQLVYNKFQTAFEESNQQASRAEFNALVEQEINNKNQQLKDLIQYQSDERARKAEVEASVPSINKALEDAQWAKTRNNRNSVIQMVFDRNVPAENIFPAIKAELKRQGFKDTELSQDDIDSYNLLKAYDQNNTTIAKEPVSFGEQPVTARSASDIEFYNTGTNKVDKQGNIIADALGEQGVNAGEQFTSGQGQDVVTNFVSPETPVRQESDALRKVDEWVRNGATYKNGMLFDSKGKKFVLNTVQREYYLNNRPAPIANAPVDMGEVENAPRKRYMGVKQQGVNAGEQMTGSIGQDQISGVEEPKTPVTVDLYRGVPKGASTEDTNATVGNSLFMTPTEQIAKDYAGKEGGVSKSTHTFNNLLEAATWAEAKSKIGLTPADTMETLVNTAREQGYDGITFTSKFNGKEYIVLKPNETKAVKTGTIENPILKKNGKAFTSQQGAQTHIRTNPELSKETHTWVKLGDEKYGIVTKDQVVSKAVNPAANLNKVQGNEELKVLIQKLGGLSRVEMKERGFTDYKGNTRLFNNGVRSRTFDDMATVLRSDHGFDEIQGANDLETALWGSLNGKPYYGYEGIDKAIDKMAADKADQDQQEQDELLNTYTNEELNAILDAKTQAEKDQLMKDFKAEKERKADQEQDTLWDEMNGTGKTTTMDIFTPERKGKVAVGREVTVEGEQLANSGTKVKELYPNHWFYGDKGAQDKFNDTEIDYEGEYPNLESISLISTDSNIGGFYDQVEQAIYQTTQSDRTTLHELGHAIHHQLLNYRKLTENERVILKEMILGDEQANHPYLASDKELVAEFNLYAHLFPVKAKVYLPELYKELVEGRKEVVIKLGSQESKGLTQALKQANVTIDKGYAEEEEPITNKYKRKEYTEEERASQKKYRLTNFERERSKIDALQEELGFTLLDESDDFLLYSKFEGSSQHLIQYSLVSKNMSPPIGSMFVFEGSGKVLASRLSYYKTAREIYGKDKATDIMDRVDDKQVLEALDDKIGRGLFFPEDSNVYNLLRWMTSSSLDSIDPLETKEGRTKQIENMLKGKIVPKSNIKFSKAKAQERLAPNGRPSNLNATQYEQVRTPEFKAWFGDWENDPENASKVVDENGEPLVAYHGTNADFNEFQREFIGQQGTAEGKGFYFTTNQSIAESYGNVKSVFLNIRNPMDYEKLTITKSQLKNVIKTLDPKGIEYLTNYGDIAYDGYNSVLNEAVNSEYESSDNDVDLFHSILNATGDNYDAVIPAFEKATSMDGTIVQNPDWGEHTIFVALNLNQIKSATGNTGEFSKESNDIRFSQAQEPTADNHTEQSLKEGLTQAGDDAYGKGWTDRLLATGMFEIISDADAQAIIEESSGAKFALVGDRSAANTQIDTTMGAYAAVARNLFAKIPNLKNILDYGAGKGRGTASVFRALKNKSIDANVKSYEPFPENWAKSLTEEPDYTNADNIKDGSQDAVVNLNVLNVVPRAIRDDIVKNIGRVLKDGGVGVISSRRWKGDVDTIKPANSRAGEEPNSFYVTRKLKGEIQTNYQKGIEPDELVAYVQELLPNFDVRKINGYGASAVIIQKPNGTPLLDSILKSEKTQSKGTGSESTLELRKEAKDLGAGERYSAFGVGKKMGDEVYLHRDYEDVLPQGDLADAKERIGDFEYNLIRYNAKTGAIGFFNSPDFDTSPEPVNGELMVVEPDGTIRNVPLNKDLDKQAIYHHKWQWVKDDYTGFDVAQSIERSIEWQKVVNREGINRKRIGFQGVWQNEVLKPFDIKYSMAGDIEAFFNPADGKTYFVAENIDKATDLHYLMMHEVGVHALNMGGNKEEFESILKQVDNLIKVKNPAALKGRQDALDADTPQEDLHEETLAYLLKYAPKLKVVERFKAWLKNALRNMAKMFPASQKLGFIQWANKLSDQDLLYIANATLRKAPEMLSKSIQLQYESDAILAAKAENRSLIVGNLERLKGENPDAHQAVMDYLDRIPEDELKRVSDNLEEFKGTPWAMVAVKSMVIRQIYHLSENYESNKDTIDKLTSGTLWGDDDISRYATLKVFLGKDREKKIQLLGKAYDFVGNNRKAENDIAGSFINCDPSKACAKHCYAALANGRPSELLKAEYTEYMASKYPEILANRIYDQYSMTAAFKEKLTLRLNDKGELSPAQLKVIELLNEKGVVLQVFSKRPELLKQVNDRNLKMLSIDTTNFDLALNNPEFKLAITLTDDFTPEMIAKIDDRVSVYLPVNLKGKEWSREKLREMYPEKYKDMSKRICPVDSENVTTKTGTSFVQVLNKEAKGLWTCTTCDKLGTVGCFKGFNTEKTAKYVSASSIGNLSKEKALAKKQDDISSMLSEFKQMEGIDNDTYRKIIELLSKRPSELSESNEQVGDRATENKNIKQNGGNLQERTGTGETTGSTSDSLKFSKKAKEGEVVNRSTGYTAYDKAKPIPEEVDNKANYPEGVSLEEERDWVITKLRRYDSFRRLNDKSNEVINKYLTTMGRLPELGKYLGMRYKTLGKIDNVDDIVRNVFDTLHKATKEDAKEIYTYLTDNKATTEFILDPEMALMAKDLKDAIKIVGMKLVEFNIIPMESYQMYEGRYLPRVYLEHIIQSSDRYQSLGSGKTLSSMGYAKRRDNNIPEEVRRLLKGEIKNPAYLASRTLSIPLRDIAMMEFFNQISDNEKWVWKQSLINIELDAKTNRPTAIFDDDGVINYNATNSALEGKPKKVVVRKVTPYFLDKEADRILDQSYSAPEEDRKDMQDLANMMKRAAAQAMSNMDVIPADFVKMPNVAKYGSLRGLVVHKLIYDDLVGTINTYGAAGEQTALENFFGNNGLLYRIANAFKFSHVALNIPTQVMNLLSNGILLHTSGVRFDKVPVRVFQAFKEILNDGENYRKMVDMGGRKATFSNQELQGITDWLLENEAEFSDKDMDWFSMVHLFRELSYLAGKGVRGASNFHQAIEMVFKTAKFIDLKSKGANDLTAAVMAHKALFDYSFVPRWVKWLRSVPFGIPFITWTVKSFEASLRTFVNRPTSLLPYYMLGYAMSLAAAADFGDDGEDKLKAILKLLPERMQRAGNVWVLPMKDDSGRTQVIDMNGLFPWSKTVEGINSLGRLVGNQDVAELRNFADSVGVFSSPITQALVAIDTNRDTFSGKQIIDENDSSAQKLQSVLEYSYNVMGIPMFSPKGDIATIYKSQFPSEYEGIMNKDGSPKKTEQQAFLHLMTGLSVKSIDIDFEKYKKLSAFENMVTGIEAQLSKELSSNPNLDAESRDRVVKKYTDRIDRVMEKRDKFEKETSVLN